MSPSNKPISLNFSEFLCNFVRRRRGLMVGLLPVLPILGHRPIVNDRWYEPKPECDRRRRRTFRSYRESGTAWDYKPGGHCRTHSTRSSPGRCARPNDAYAAEHQCLWPELSAFLHRLCRPRLQRADDSFELAPNTAAMIAWMYIAILNNTVRLVQFSSLLERVLGSPIN